MFSIFFQTFEFLVLQDSSYFSHNPMSYVTAAVRSLWKILLKRCLVTQSGIGNCNKQIASYIQMGLDHFN